MWLPAGPTETKESMKRKVQAKIEDFCTRYASESTFIKYFKDEWQSKTFMGAPLHALMHKCAHPAFWGLLAWSKKYVVINASYASSLFQGTELG